MAYNENAHPERQLGTGEEHFQTSELTRCTYHAQVEIQPEFLTSGLADAVSEEHFPRHSSPTALTGYASTNPSSGYDIGRHVSTSRRQPPARRHTVWGQVDQGTRYLATSLIEHLTQDHSAAEELAQAPDLLQALLGLNIGYRLHAEKRFRHMLQLGLIRVINGRLDVLYDRETALGHPFVHRNIPRVIRAGVVARDGSVCRLCGQTIGEAEPIDLDHIVPVVAGGENAASNLRVTHRLCNRRRPADGGTGEVRS